MKILLIVLSFTVSLQAFSQSNYVEKLLKNSINEGTVVFHQDSRITSLLNSDSAFTKPENNTHSNNSASNNIKGVNAKTSKNHKSDTLNTAEVNGEGNLSTHTRRYKVEGYRIQIYAGNNSRKSRIEATRAGQRIKNFFPELPVYTHFYPPRWICRVGDFRTVEEAQNYLAQIRDLKIFSAVTLIKTTVQATY